MRLCELEKAQFSLLCMHIHKHTHTHAPRRHTGLPDASTIKDGNPLDRLHPLKQAEGCFHYCCLFIGKRAPTSLSQCVSVYACMCVYLCL